MSAATRDESVSGGRPASLETHHEVQCFLFAEALALDEERFQDWLAMMAPDVHYWLPVRENRFRKDRRPDPTPADCASVYNDNLLDLQDRVGRFETGMAWIEDPPGRVRRIVSNVLAEHIDSDDELAVTSNILLYRNRRQDEEAWFVAGRRDRLRRIDGQWRLARRHILLDQHVILDENLSVFL